MFRRTIAFAVLAWLFGFLWFAMALPQPFGEGRTDAIIVLTGSTGRIEHAVKLLEKGRASRLLVSGVDREVKPHEFAAQFGVSPQLLKCCVTLGYRAYDTRSNAIEAAAWVSEHKARSVRLVTADWHMRRAMLELSHEMPADVEMKADAVPSRPSLGVLFLEYHKLLARAALDLWNRYA
ncbi:MAG TPA: YdcF family protein [Novosphingobium sp.]|nr:YdcF family protein [Novosphingobium sp.]